MFWTLEFKNWACNNLHLLQFVKLGVLFSIFMNGYFNNIFPGERKSLYNTNIAYSEDIEKVFWTIFKTPLSKGPCKTNNVDDTISWIRTYKM